MKKYIRVFGACVLVPLLIAGFCAGFVWRNNRQSANDKALIAAVCSADAPAVIAALKNGANPNSRAIPDNKRSLTERFLELVRPGRPRSSQYGPRIEDYRTALSLTVFFQPDHAATIEALLDAGADPNAKIIYPASLSTDYGNPLLWAEKERQYTAAHLLVAHHADTGVLNENDETPLMIAAGNNSDAEVAWLIQHGADIEGENSGGQRALCYAIDYDAEDAAQYLVEHGADVNHKNKEGYNALYYARKHKRPAIVNLLLKAGANH